MKQKVVIYEYIEKFCDLQVFIININETEALDVFKQGLKYQILKLLMVSNPSTGNKAIAIAQWISGAYDVTHCEPISNFWESSGPTTMELENLRRKEGFALTRKHPQDLELRFDDQ